MLRRTAAGVALATAAALLPSTAVADEAPPLSSGCWMLGSGFYDGSYARLGGSPTLAAGEMVSITSDGTGEVYVRLTRDGATVAEGTAAAPGTASVVVPADGTYGVRLGTSDGRATHAVTCGPAPAEALVVDADGDGVADEEDRCVDSAVDPAATRPNRFVTDDAGAFVDGRGREVATLEDTAGCTATDIAGELGLGRGHERFGVTRGVLQRWIRQVG